jgi:excisionase family DNA binding protein
VGTETIVTEYARSPIAMTKQEAAQMLGVSLRTIDRLIALKELHVRRLGRRVLIPRAALESLMHRDHPTQTLENARRKVRPARWSEKWAPSTFNHYRSLMSLSYRLGILNRKVTSNPARSVTHRREDNNRVRFLTEEEEKKLRNVIEGKWSLHVPELDLAINTVCGRAVSTA